MTATLAMMSPDGADNNDDNVDDEWSRYPRTHHGVNDERRSSRTWSWRRSSHLQLSLSRR
ncbi:hypothetical protein PPTG_10640 [Phytophthora nicotianae INRA-310]|uniref:Uncharacterized protein n=1 Tax=Phytophthora nicotianae (strain INRA-310) TaxID=761204 RepID=W2QCB1_PHYN3|nr:hypothetical protein PPTG_10640 [Phytophthora nicotianae INRA-310]ETN10516.1 hypothetical protein PPTG_10640 [Phytophthora nicotianae INRA-310]